ncbi:MAG TPA: MFS transporter, partial [Acidimicrobiales bacterium]|nr:MFS transporter [Acidimicrobiales bacterium]
MLTATFMQLVDVSIVNVAIPSIQRDLHASYAAIQFVVAGYQMAFAASLVTAARLGDIFGRRRLFLIGMAGFTAASALCAAAPSAQVLVAGRVLLGLMSGVMFPQVLSVIQVVFPAEGRARAFAVLGAVVGLATITGPLAGGGLIAWDLAGLSWRLIFYVNVPVGALALSAAFARLPESRSPDRPRLDLPGALLVTVALLMVVYPLTEGRQLGWPAWSFAVLASSLVVFAGFAAHQRRRTRSGRWPLVHTSLFKDRAFVAGLVLTVVFFSGVPAFFLVTTLYLQFGFGFSALHAGLTTFPFAVGTALGSAASEPLTGRLGKQVLQLGAAALVLAMGVVMLSASQGPTLSSLQLLPGFVLAGVGVGLVVAPNANLILAGIRSEAAGSASGVLSTGQQVGGVLGIALVGVFFFGLLSSSAPAAARA